jgi:hypothetical protein
MDPQQVAKRLRKAEAELQRAQRHHDGSLEAVERYRAAVSEHGIAWAVAHAVGREAR